MLPRDFHFAQNMPCTWSFFLFRINEVKLNLLESASLVEWILGQNKCGFKYTILNLESSFATLIESLSLACDWILLS